MIGANLGRAKLYEADLSLSDLSNASLRKAHAPKVNLEWYKTRRGSPYRG
jgi:uncharacterized protein YjbI with pentapeptide repeats